MSTEEKTVKRRYPPEVRRRMLLQTAIGLFCEHGVEGTTMQQIADRADVSYGLFYHYFESKDALLEAAVDEMSVLPQIRELLADHQIALRQQMRQLARQYLTLIEERKEIVWLVFTESRKRPQLANAMAELAIQSRAALHEYLDARRHTGEVRADIDLDIATRTIWSYLFMRHLWIEEEPPAEAHLDLIVDGLLTRN